MEKVLVLENKYVDTLGDLRGMPGLKCAAEGELIWLRWTSGTDTDKRVLSLPVIHTYLLDKDDFLFPLYSKTPVAKLPSLNWQALKAFLPVTLPVSAMPGKMFLPMDVRLQRSETPKEAVALLTTLAIWKTYVETAPETRLRLLRFAVSAKSEVLVLGKPLPQLPGQSFWLDDHLLVPTGFDFDPPVLAGFIKNDLFPTDKTFALFLPDGQWQCIPLSAFQAARRSAVRLTRVSHA